MTAVGFTGSRHAITQEQVDRLDAVLRQHSAGAGTFAHGDATGADETAHFIAMDLHYTVHVWPPKDNKARAFTTGHFIHAPADYPVRNQSIVMMADVLIACPAGPEEDNPRSGTWQTVRKARRKGIPITIIYPDGTTEEEPGAEIRE